MHITPLQFGVRDYYNDKLQYSYINKKYPNGDKYVGFGDRNIRNGYGIMRYLNSNTVATKVA